MIYYKIYIINHDIIFVIASVKGSLRSLFNFAACYFYENLTGEPCVKKLNLFGVVYPYEDCINAVAVSKFLGDLQEAEEFTVYINSPGGSVFEGLAIYNLLSEYSSQMTIKVIGEASSIASVIACAGGPGKTLIAESALMLIHKPWTFAVVDEDYIKKLEKELETIKNSIITVYARKTGKTPDELNDLMTKSEYHSALSCAEMGFADKVYVPSDEDTSIKNQSDRIVKQHMNKYLIMNLNIFEQKKEFKMTLEEALNKIGALENKVTSLDEQAAVNQTALSDLTKQNGQLKETNQKLQSEFEALSAENQSLKDKLDKQHQDLILSEETEFCNRLVDEMKLTPVEKDAQIKVLVSFRNQPDVMFDEGKPLYNHLRETLQARQPMADLSNQINTDQKTDQKSDFAITPEMLTTAAGRKEIDAEVRRRMEANGTDYETELNNLRKGD